MKSYIDSLKTIEGKANSLAFNEIVLGGYQAFFKDLEKYNAITSEQIKATSEKLLNPWQRNTLVVTGKAKP
jgi:zinc protease